jgi:twitching motility two-component system response regulator PilG
MISKKAFVIGLFGISAHEQRILQTICLISRSRPQTYVLQNDVPFAVTDIAIVDQDNSKAVSAWELYQDDNPMLPAIMLTRQPEAEPAGYQLGRPLMATHLLKLLDQILKSEEHPAIASPHMTETQSAVPAEDARITQHIPSDKNAINNQLSALVVDDSLPVRRQIGIHLAPLVGRVDLAEDGERAIEFIANQSFDIIFLDVVLPGMDGYKICREIKRNKRTKNTPVIMLTGKSSPFDKVKGKLAGCDAYLTKPVDDKTFNEVVYKYLEIRKADETLDDHEKLPDDISEHI